MFANFIKAVKSFFTAEPLKTQFEEMVLQEAIKEQPAVTPAPVAVKALPTAVNDQITDSVTQAPVKPKRAKAAKKVEGEEAPAKKPRTPRKKKAE